MKCISNELIKRNFIWKSDDDYYHIK